MVQLSLCLTPWQRRSTLPVLPVAALLCCISDHPLYPDQSLLPQTASTLTSSRTYGSWTLSVPQLPGELQPLVSTCYEPHKYLAPAYSYTHFVSISINLREVPVPVHLHDVCLYLSTSPSTPYMQNHLSPVTAEQLKSQIIAALCCHSNSMHILPLVETAVLYKEACGVVMQEWRCRRCKSSSWSCHGRGYRG